MWQFYILKFYNFQNILYAITFYWSKLHSKKQGLHSPFHLMKERSYYFRNWDFVTTRWHELQTTVHSSYQHIEMTDDFNFELIWQFHLPATKCQSWKVNRRNFSVTNFSQQCCCLDLWQMFYCCFVKGHSFLITPIDMTFKVFSRLQLQISCK